MITIDDIPERLRGPGLILVQDGEHPAVTVKLSAAVIEQFAQVFSRHLQPSKTYERTDHH